MTTFTLLSIIYCFASYAYMTVVTLGQPNKGIADVLDYLLAPLSVIVIAVVKLKDLKK